MSELRSHPHLSLAEHLAEIRAAARAIWGRHSQTLHRQAADAERWFDDSVTLHDAGKGSAAFQTYIAAPTYYKGRPEDKAHTPLSTVCVLRLARKAGWDWRRALTVALIAAGHHSGFKTGEELDHAVSSMDEVINKQIRTLDWAALDRAIGIAVPRSDGLNGLDLCVEASDYLQDELLESLRRLPLTEAVTYRLLCQLAFSVLLEADKAFLAVPDVDRTRYLAPREAQLPPGLVEDFLAEKPAAAINPLRDAARRELFAGMDRVADRRVQTMTLPTGTGKTLLAASWALTLRERIRQAEGQPPLVLIVLPFLAVIDQTVNEYRQLFDNRLNAGEMITYHSLSDRTYDPDLEDQSQNFFLDTWRSDVVLTTFDQFLFALLSPKSRHQMRFHHLTDAVIVLDEVQAMPCILWDPLRQALDGLTKLGTTHVLAMSATQPGFLNQPGELIEKPGDFFAQMARYRIVLRHRTPLKLSAFIAECQGRLSDWSNQRVLITLNTRRSARRVRDALAEKLPPATKLEFLSADVTPRDRLAAIQRIKECVKQKRPCLVVSTQCIEAGVDIDMDFVIRDFAPLDSLIQVAGRCNRNGSAERGTVEIVSLEEDDRNSSFAGMVYTDKILLSVTREILAGREVVEEEQVYPLTREYFDRLAKEKDTGEEVTRAWVRWEETKSAKKLLRGEQRPQVGFIVLENDPALLADLESASRVPDRWKRRDELKKLARRLAENTVNVYRRDDLDPADYADPFPAHKKGEDVWFWLLRPNYYTAERGLVLRDGDEVDSWGMIL
jgi:CRISPR-associated endonuclease/helicase Cas3